MAPTTRPAPARDGRAAYSLIELLTVIVIVAVLAAVALPNLWGAGDEALRSTVRHDLRNLVQAQEIYFNDNNAYAAAPGDPTLQPSEAVTFTVLEATGSGWSGTAVHERLDPDACAVFVGTAVAVPPATVARQIACD
jgi:prepilin-type N-terminal cleavage/methylation domain-containing protein